jgi:hypothetical protein
VFKDLIIVSCALIQREAEWIDKEATEKEKTKWRERVKVVVVSVEKEDGNIKDELA